MTAWVASSTNIAWWHRFPAPTGPDLGLAAQARAAGAGQDRREDVVADSEQCGDGPGGVWQDVVAAGPAGFADELHAQELAQVVGGLPGAVAETYLSPWPAASRCSDMAPLSGLFSLSNTSVNASNPQT
jgi:hypothetical protein